jgi:hypothetical protein
MTRGVLQNERLEIAEEENAFPLERDFNNTAGPNTRMTVHVTLI